MKKKSFEGMSGQLSRTRMRDVVAGRPYNPDCKDCMCNDGSVSYLKNGSCYCDSGYVLPCSVGTGNQ